MYRGSRGVLFDPEALLEEDAVHDLRQVRRSPSPMPPLRGTLIQFAHHGQHGDAGEAAACFVRA